MLSRLSARLWPHSLKGQVLLAIALALLLAQAFSAALLYRAQHDRREAALVHTAAMRLVAASRGNFRFAPPPRMGDDRPDPPPGPGMRAEWTPNSPQRTGETRVPADEQELRDVLADQGVAVDDLVVLRRPVANDPIAAKRVERRFSLQPPHARPDELLLAGLRPAGNAQWLVVRVVVPGGERQLLGTLLAQTLFIYALLVGSLWLILRRITRPLAALTERLERFAETREADGQLEPQGPEDIRRLIKAHNAMEGSIAALLGEKDVMLGAIGHDLKTPLAALRVRIETVEDEGERAKMAATIEDITRTLDDILSLARVGRPTDAREPTELSALVGALVEEYEDMGEPVVLGDTRRVVLSVRPTWLRRALRNLIGNALRYGKVAHVSLESDGRQAVIRIVDEGPGIAEDQITRMLEPFTRGEPSRNTETGGAGLGLTLARAIAEQHGGTLRLTNRRKADGSIAGLEAVLHLPF